MAEGSPAAAVLEVDDVIVAVDGEAVDEIGEVGELLQPGGPGATHTLTVERPAGGDTRVDVEVTTIAAADDPTRAIIGIAPEDRISGFDFPIDVTIDSGTVGGPSAGLAFTLAVLDVLTPGELTGGPPGGGDGDDGARRRGRPGRRRRPEGRSRCATTATRCSWCRPTSWRRCARRWATTSR